MIIAYRGKKPVIAEDSYLSKNATIIGDVTLEKGSSVFFHTVVRGDKDAIFIGENSNIQDNCTLHTDPGHELKIGKCVTVGHNAILHGCIIEDEVLIGMGAIILNEAVIGKHSIIGAGAVVTQGQIIPENSLVVGCPAKIIKQVNAAQVEEIKENALHYAELGREYKEMEV
ncbi:gamma carbonic anhydrase family protein [Erysipelotrichaceae bacterium HCN-30851]